MAISTKFPPRCDVPLDTSELKLYSTLFNVNDMLKEKINAAIALDMGADITALKVFKIMLNVQNGDRLNQGQDALYKDCQPDLERLMQFIIAQRIIKINDKIVEKFREIISVHAMGRVVERMQGSRDSGNAYYLLNYVDKNLVLRIRPNGDIEIPNRIDQPYKLSKQEIKDNNLDEIAKFLTKARDRKMLEKVFDERIAPRYQEVGVAPEKIARYKKQLIDKLVNEISFDVVRGVSSLGRRTRIAHTRHGQIKERGPAIWVGEMLIRELCSDTLHPRVKEYGRTSNLEAFMELMLEEAQHFDAPVGIQHENGQESGKLQELLEDNGLLYPNRIRHDNNWRNMFGYTNRDIETRFDEKNGLLNLSPVGRIE